MIQEHIRLPLFVIMTYFRSGIYHLAHLSSIPMQYRIPRFFLTAAVTFFTACLGTGIHAEQTESWLFTPPRTPTVPNVATDAETSHPIDAFIQRKLQPLEIPSAPEASRQTLIRRLYFDLIGVPPEPTEVSAFLSDSGNDPYGALIDRLLEDPRYGERWARHWLDLARYADTAGFEGDPDLPHAWRYRDYVIDAFNNDKPYDRFILEQIAGDEITDIFGAGDLPQPSAEQIVAMTFLRLAPFTEPRGDETRHELLSEMTATVGSVFLGLTVGCAKCHDHKYENIPTKDFYRLKAFFATVQIPRPEPGDIFQIGGPIPAPFYRPGEKEWAEQQTLSCKKQLEVAQDHLKSLKTELEGILQSPAGFGFQISGAELGNHYFFEPTSVTDGSAHSVVVTADNKSWKMFTDGVASSELHGLSGKNLGAWFGDLPQTKHISLGMHTAGTGKLQGNAHIGTFSDILIYDHPLTESERAVLNDYSSTRRHSKSSAHTPPPQQGLRFWLDASDLDADPVTSNPPSGAVVHRWQDRISHIDLSQKDPQRQPLLTTLGPEGTAAVQFDHDFLLGNVETATFLNDQQGSMVLIFSATHDAEGYGLEIGGGGAFISTVIHPKAGQKASVEEVLKTENDTRISDTQRQTFRNLSNQERFLKQQLKRLSPAAMSLRHSYGPPYEPGVPTSRIHIRGEWDNLGEVVKPGFLSCITGNQKPAAIRLDPFKRWPARSRRMALARWIASPDNPLTARVIVNRIWFWHFGSGIVPTPSDFGELSGGPSHPDLLDWLAAQFIENNWSIKSLHRLICSSNTYRQQSNWKHAASEVKDPDNRLLWKFNRRRLDAEAIRDSVLAVSGRLNPEHYGLPVFPPLPGDIAETVKYTDSKWHTQSGPQGRKRSIYIYQQRTLTMPFMQTFDALVCDESRPKRQRSVTPLQALSMYNGDFVNIESLHFAKLIRKACGNDPNQQIHQSFQRALSRDPTEEETDTLLRFMSAQPSSDQALIGLCRILYNSNEFLYID